MIQQTGTLLVSAIKDGTVIDHIKAGMSLKILAVLGLKHDGNMLTVGMNLKSKSSGKKDIIKITDWEIAPTEANRVAIFAPNATINIIKDFKIKKKFTIDFPKEISGLIVCPNPKCITNNEPMDSLFHTKKQTGGVALKCHYCEKTFKQEEIKEYKA